MTENETYTKRVIDELQKLPHAPPWDTDCPICNACDLIEKQQTEIGQLRQQLLEARMDVSRLEGDTNIKEYLNRKFRGKEP